MKKKTQAQTNFEELLSEYGADRAKPHTLSLPVPLTPEEFKDRAQRLAAANVDARDVEARKKQVMEAFKEEAGGVQARIRSLGQIVEDSAEKRAVDCVDLSLGRTKEIITVRLDTGELVCRRAMQAFELQEEMQLS